MLIAIIHTVINDLYQQFLDFHLDNQADIFDIGK